MTQNKLKGEVLKILKNTEDSSFECGVLLEHCLGVSKTELVINPNREIPKARCDAVIKGAKKRAEGYPLQYIIGEWEFYSLPFKVTEDTLIPRADTETLVDEALKFIDGREGLDIIDLCSGSGCIAISVAKNAKNCSITALEKYPATLKVLKENAKLNDVDIKIASGDVLEKGTGEYDLILSNPPYIKTEVINTLQQEVMYEPKVALDGGEDGLLFYRAILKHWAPRLKPLGALMVEIGYDQAEEVSSLFEEAGLENITAKCDINGNRRVIIGTAKTKTD